MEVSFWLIGLPTNCKVSLDYYNGMSHKAHNIIHESNQMTSSDDVTHSTLIVMITVQSIFKPSRPTRVNYVTMSTKNWPQVCCMYKMANHSRLLTEFDL